MRTLASTASREAGQRTMTVSTDENHAETVALLNEVLRYLERLPRVPVTAEFVLRVREHLRDPVCQQLADARLQRRGEAYEPSGRKIVSVTVQGDSLAIQVSDPVSPRLYAQGGLVVKLSAPEPVNKTHEHSKERGQRGGTDPGKNESF